jgi:predicted PurR-regulated permease PerM
MSEQVRAHSATPPEQAASSRNQNWPLVVLAIGVLIAFCYFAQWALAVIIISILLAFILAPVVELLQRLRVPRHVGSVAAVLLLVTAVYGVFYLCYSQALSLADNLPKYSSEIRSIVASFRQNAEKLEQSTEAVFGSTTELRKSESGKSEKPASPLAPSRAPSPLVWDIFFRGVSSIWQVLLPLSFTPFLVYFMLTWQQHARSATVMLFSMPHRHAAYTTIGLISAMVRSFLIGNFLVGLFMSVISTVVFGIIHLPSFYVVGFVSGFLSLIPYLGVILASVAPLLVGLGHVHSTGLLTIVVTVVALHLFGLNVLYPKFLGDRLQLNPLAVTIALLLWGGLWGAVGLVLAVPITAAMKIIFDNIDSLRPYGTWLGE